MANQKLNIQFSDTDQTGKHFSKGPDSKYFQLCGLPIFSIQLLNSATGSVKAAKDNT